MPEMPEGDPKESKAKVDTLTKSEVKIDELQKLVKDLVERTKNQE